MGSTKPPAPPFCAARLRNLLGSSTRRSSLSPGWCAASRSATGKHAESGTIAGLPQGAGRAKAPGGLRLATTLLAAFLCVLSGCGAAEPPKPSLEADDPALVLWPRVEKAIRLHFSAERNLNLYDGKAHSIQVCVYQLHTPEAFLERAATPEGIAALLKAEAFDASVKSVVRLFVQPLENAVFTLDRAENALFVGLVCGYFDSTPAESFGLWEIRPQEIVTRHLLWPSTITYRAGTLDLALRLTARALVESGGNAEPQAATGREQ